MTRCILKMPSASKWVQDPQIDQIDPPKQKGAGNGPSQVWWIYEWSYDHLKTISKNGLFWLFTDMLSKIHLQTHIGHLGFLCGGHFSFFGVDSQLSGGHSQIFEMRNRWVWVIQQKSQDLKNPQIYYYNFIMLTWDTPGTFKPDPTLTTSNHEKNQ